MNTKLRQSIIDELSDLMNRRVVKIVDDRKLLHAEKQCFPYVKVIEIYNYYKKHGLIEASKHFNMSQSCVVKRFRYYNLPMDYLGSNNHSKNRHKQTFTPTQKHFDALSMDYSEWKLKYINDNANSRGSYYSYGKNLKKHLAVSE